jgi:predicted transcriptional regulator of viral defense system
VTRYALANCPLKGTRNGPLRKEIAGNAMNVNALGDWVDGLQASGRYSFLRQEAIDASGISAEAVKKTLQRLAKRKRIAKVNDSFYVVVPTEYMNAGSPPASWFIHHLMETMKQPYYVALLSAASLHGASHHQPQEFQVITNKSVRPLRIARQRIHFFTKRSVDQTPVIDMKTPTGMIHVSTPEATVLDVVRFSKAAGQLGNVATVVSELAEKLKPEALLEAAEKQGEIPTVQRLGYLLELSGAEAIASPLAEWLIRQRPRSVRLRADRPIEGAARHPKWNIFVNETIEVEH